MEINVNTSKGILTKKDSLYIIISIMALFVFNMLVVAIIMALS
ncbi:hypothetical protein [uncultured Maribacter sp.]